MPGNHFLELDSDAEGGVWLLVHSGSRGFGAAVTAHHARVARAVGVGRPARIEVESPPGAAFLNNVHAAFEFARENRERMAQLATACLGSTLGREVRAVSSLDVHHNFVEQERHGDRELWTHRKGAIKAPFARIQTSSR